jgi:hypothetical protein
LGRQDSDLSVISDRDREYYDLISNGRTSNRATNVWESLSGWNSEGEIQRPDRQNEEPGTRDDLHSRADSASPINGIKTVGMSEYQRQELYERQGVYPNEDPASSRNYFHNGVTGLERIKEGQFVPLYEQMKMMNDQVTAGYSSPQLTIDNGQVQANSTSPYDAESYSGRKNSDRSRTDDHMAYSPRQYHPAEATATSQGVDAFARQQLQA